MRRFWYIIDFCKALYLICRYGPQGAMAHITIELALQKQDIDELLQETIAELKKRKGG